MKTIKALGQHWLKDRIVVHQILEAFAQGHGASDEPNVLEIGPGAGALSHDLIATYGERIWFSEVDQRAVEELMKEGVAPSQFLGDFLSPDLQLPKSPMSLIGNFPYNISSQIVFKIIELRKEIPWAVGMFQKEVALRIAASHKKKAFGILSVLSQAYYSVEYLFTVPPSAFSPPPKVDSGVISFKHLEEPFLGSEAVLRKLLKIGFSQRRKKLSNVLKLHPDILSLLSERQLDCRAEELSVVEWCELALLLEKEST